MLMKTELAYTSSVYNICELLLFSIKGLKHLRRDDAPVARDRLLSIHYFCWKVFGPLDGSVE